MINQRQETTDHILGGEKMPHRTLTRAHNWDHTIYIESIRVCHFDRSYEIV